MFGVEWSKLFKVQRYFRSLVQLASDDNQFSEHDPLRALSLRAGATVWSSRMVGRHASVIPAAEAQQDARPGQWLTRF